MLLNSRVTIDILSPRNLEAKKRDTYRYRGTKYTPSNGDQYQEIASSNWSVPNRYLWTIYKDSKVGVRESQESRIKPRHPPSSSNHPIHAPRTIPSILLNHPIHPPPPILSHPIPFLPFPSLPQSTLYQLLSTPILATAHSPHPTSDYRLAIRKYQFS